MPYQKPKHAVRFCTNIAGYECLLSALNLNLECGVASIEENAHRLLDKIEKHKRFYTDDDGVECVDMRFFDNEASKLIYQLIAAFRQVTPDDDS